jgi:seryl-tRNA synthetase
VIDLKLLQKDFESVCALLEIKHVKTDLLLELKEKVLAHKSALADFENTKAEQNAISKQFGMLKAKGEDIAPLQAKVGELKKAVASLSEIANEKEAALNALALTIPNLPNENVPLGKSEEENVEIKKVLTPKEFTFAPKEHHELGVDLGWLDFERGVKLAKSRFTVLKSDAARLERALINYMLDFNRGRGFEEVWVPAIANRDSLQGTGQLPKFADDLFKIEDEELYLIPTAEVPLTNLFRDEILTSDELPIMMTGYTACYRKEAGSAGRDTHGIIRQHQFDKVEMVCLTKPEESQAMFDKMVECASDLLTSLELPHRQVRLCGGDLGFSAESTIDLEVWLPGQQMYREISSISNVGDFQARRAKIRFKDGKKNVFVNTLNGSSLAVGRTLVALMENGQNEDGSITIPPVLKAYL